MTAHPPSDAASPAGEAFRREVRAWLAREIPDHLKGRRDNLAMPLRHSTLADLLARAPQWRPVLDALERRGWLAPAWPREHGGAGFDAEQLFAFDAEWLAAGLPPLGSDGLDKVGPTLIAAGTPAQQRRFLDPTRRREIVWAQGYSEPGAGSDLAHLTLRADRVPGGFRLTGRKTWTSNAHLADWLYVLGRTDAAARPAHAGISLFLVDARSPGLSIRPIIGIDGYHHLNETTFEEVFVPEAQVVGGLNEGWRVANILLGHERFTHPSVNPVYHDHALGELKRFARSAGERATLPWDDAGLRRTIAALEADIDDLRTARRRAQVHFIRTGRPGPETSIFKLWGGALMQRIIEAHHALVGPAGLAWEAEPFGEAARDLARRSTRVRAYSISGGTREVQRNIVARRVLGLPGR